MGKVIQQETVGARALQRMGGLSMRQVEVASAIEMSADAFSRALHGQRNFKLTEMAALAEHLNTSIHWLVTGERDPYEVKMSARHQWNEETRSDEPHDWSAGKRVCNDIANIYFQAGLDAAPHQAEIHAVNDPYETARTARAFLSESIREGETFAGYLPALIERAFGFDVFVIDHEVEFEAYSGEANGTKFIVQKVTGAWWRAFFNLAHELGHILHNDLAFSDEEKEIRPAESWANAFAAELVLPRQEMLDFDWAGGNANELAEFALSHRVSPAVLRIRTKTLGCTPNDELAKALNWTTPQLVQTIRSPFWQAPREENYDIPRFPDRVVAAHQKALDNGETNGQTLAWMLNLRVEDVNPRWGMGSSMSVDDLLGIL